MHWNGIRCDSISCSRDAKLYPIFPEWIGRIMRWMFSHQNPPNNQNNEDMRSDGKTLCHPPVLKVPFQGVFRVSSGLNPMHTDTLSAKVALLMRPGASMHSGPRWPAAGRPLKDNNRSSRGRSISALWCQSVQMSRRRNEINLQTKLRDEDGERNQDAGLCDLSENHFDFLL